MKIGLDQKFVIFSFPCLNDIRFECDCSFFISLLFILGSEVSKRTE